LKIKDNRKTQTSLPAFAIIGPKIWGKNQPIIRIY